MNPINTLALTKQLIEQPSVTPDDSGCQAMIAELLDRVGFTRRDYSSADVINTLYSHGEGEPHLMLLGHTDVVPPGPEADWDSPAYEPTERGGCLYGRGVADMKGAVAAMVTAMQQLVQIEPKHRGRLSLLLTSDEEGVADHGVRAVMPKLLEDELMPDYCLVGEPSSLQRLGDNIRIGRRGSIQGVIRFYGQQGHTAYAAVEDNPIHRASAAIKAIAEERFDEGDEHFPATLLHFSNVHAGTGATNVTPGMLTAQFNIRNNTLSSASHLQQRIDTILKANDCGRYELDWRVSGEPFITNQGALLDAVQHSITAATGIRTHKDTGGGTSDGRFFASHDVQVVELGLINKTIHQVNESTNIADLDVLHGLYLDICMRLLGENPLS